MGMGSMVLEMVMEWKFQSTLEEECQQYRKKK
jgi:hypothetical protein